MKTLAYAAYDKSSPLKPFDFERRKLRPNDIKIEILYCGVCHSDLHTAKSEWAGTIYPVVPGHEIVGRITQMGSAVKNFKVGDFAAVGCLVDSCRTCPSCKDHLEQYCQNGMVFTYNSHDLKDGKVTYGGYSTDIVVDEKFVLHVPKAFTEKDLPNVAPLLCAGITTYSPLRYWNVGKGSKVGVVGLGGLGHMAIKLAHAMGAEVTLLTTSPNKLEDAKRLGASRIIMWKNHDELAKNTNSLDLIINTVAAPHDLGSLLSLLKLNGTMCLVGAPSTPHPELDAKHLIFKRRNLAGSLIGGIQETQEMLDFCAQHGITADVEIIPIQKINEAYDRMLKSDVKYRFVIDTATLK